MEHPKQQPQQPLPWPRLRDDVLRDELRDFLAHEERLRNLALSVRVDGGVAHVGGEVGSEDERQLARRLLRRQGGLFAVWDLLALPARKPTVADIGCGRQKQIEWAWGIDRRASPAVDVVTDLEHPLPLRDDAFDHVFAVHVLEHVNNLIGLMNELHRIVKPTGVLHVLTPYWRHVNAVADPTHVRLMDEQTLRYFCQPHPGIRLWAPLLAAGSEDTVFADLQPRKDGSVPDRLAIARWFY